MSQDSRFFKRSIQLKHFFILFFIIFFIFLQNVQQHNISYDLIFSGLRLDDAFVTTMSLLVFFSFIYFLLMVGSAV